MQRPSYRVTPNDSTSNSPYRAWRLFVVTPDYAALKRVQEAVAGKFQAVEFEPNGAAARARMRDRYAPDFKLVMIDQSVLHERDVARWKRTLHGLSRRPFLLMLKRGESNAPVKWAAELGCIGILDVNGPLGTLVRDLVTATTKRQVVSSRVTTTPIPTPVPEAPTTVFDQLHPKAEIAASIKIEDKVAPVAAVSDYDVPLMPDFMHWLPQIRPPATAAIADLALQIRDHDWLGEYVLAVANSSVYRQDGAARLDKVEAALGRLGLIELATVLPIIALRQAFLKTGASQFGETLWRYMIAGGIAYRVLHEQIADSRAFMSAPDAFLAGALRNAGMLLMYRKDAGYGDVTGMGFQWDVSGVDQCTWERRRYGITHPAISYAVCRGWNVRKEIAEAIKIQHVSERGMLPPDIDRVAKMFTLADAVCASWLFPMNGVSLVNDPVRILLQEFRMTAFDLDDVRHVVTEEMRKYAEIWPDGGK